MATISVIAVAHRWRKSASMAMLVLVTLLHAGEARAIDDLQYIASYSDLIRAFGANAAAGEQHYLSYGLAEGRVPDAFNEAQYLANYPDLQAAFGADTLAATIHYIQYGFAEGRTDKPILTADAAEAIWHFDETSGIVAVDATGNGHNGKLSNVVIGKPGHTGRAYYFNGINAKVVVPNVFSLRPGSRNVSISVWYKNVGCPQRDPADCDLWKHGASPAPRTKMEVLHSGMVDCGFAGSKNHIDIVGGPAGGVADGKWHKIECSKSATQVTMLVDGRTIKSSKVVIGDINPNRDATIGASGGSDWTTGLIDEVTVVYSP